MNLYLPKPSNKKLSLKSFKVPTNRLSSRLNVTSHASSKRNTNTIHRHTRATTLKLDSTSTYFLTEPSDSSLSKNIPTERVVTSYRDKPLKILKPVKGLLLKEDLIKKVTERNQVKKSPYNCFNEIKALLFKKKVNIKYHAPLSKANKAKQLILNSKTTIGLNDLDTNRNYNKKFNKTLILKEQLNNHHTISSGFLPSIEDTIDNEELVSPRLKKIFEKSSKIKTDRFFKLIENMVDGEYEDPTRNISNIFSYRNLSRVIELKKIQKGGGDGEEIEVDNKEKKDIQEQLEILKLGAPKFIKKSFKNSTIERYKNIKGIYFGEGRTKEV